MKTQNLHVSFRNLIITTTLAVASFAALAQDTAATAPQLSYGVSQVLQLSQAKVADDVVVRYIQNSGTIFALSAPEIVYLKQQGVSDAVLNTMLGQRERLTGSTEPATAPMENSATTQTSVIVAQPASIYIQPIPSTMVYVMPDTQTYRYDRWHYGYDNGFRYGNGFDDWPYSYHSVSVTVGIGARRAGHFSRNHFVRSR